MKEVVIPQQCTRPNCNCLEIADANNGGEPVKNYPCLAKNKSGGVDLKKLQEKFDKFFKKETSESFAAFIDKKQASALHTPSENPLSECNSDNPCISGNILLCHDEGCQRHKLQPTPSEDWKERLHENAILGTFRTVQDWTNWIESNVIQPLRRTLAEAESKGYNKAYQQLFETISNQEMNLKAMHSELSLIKKLYKYDPENKEITGFDTLAEWQAYDKGQKDGEKLSQLKAAATPKVNTLSGSIKVKSGAGVTSPRYYEPKLKELLTELIAEAYQKNYIEVKSEMSETLGEWIISAKMNFTKA